MVQRVSTNNFACAKWIVDASGVSSGATHSTISGALADAVSGETIFVRPGVYTEDPTLKAGVNIASFPCDAETPNTTLVGTLSASFAGKCTLFGIRCQTNSSPILSVTGTDQTLVFFNNSFINATNNTAFVSTTTNNASQIALFHCHGNLAATGISYYTIDNGIMRFWFSRMANGGGSSTVSTSANNSAVTVKHCSFGIGVTTSDTSAIDFNNCDLFGSSTFTINGTGTNEMHFCRVETGNQTCVSIGTGATLDATHNFFDTTATNVLAGAGTIRYAANAFGGSTTIDGALTQTALSIKVGTSI